MLALLLAGMLAVGQDAPKTTVAELLPKLVENGRRYQEALPSLSCEESIVSQEVKHGKVKKEVHVEATLRVKRTGRTRPAFEDTHDFKTHDGISYLVDPHVHYPYFATGVFSNALGFSSLAELACFDIALDDAGPEKPLRLDLKTKDHAGDSPACDWALPGLAKTILIDRASGHITHLDRTVPRKLAEKLHEVEFGSVDYAPVELGGETFWLPSRVETRGDKDEGRMQAVYTGCKRYTASVTITGGTETVPDPQ